MKYLILIRHAKSSWKNQILSDHDRPLNKRGKKAALLMGQKLAYKPIKPELIISSTAKRALITAKKIAKEINHPKSKIKADPNLYHASTLQLLGVISKSPNTIHNLMLVGHNPSMTFLANSLLKKHQFDNIPTAGMVTLSLSIKFWKDILSNDIKIQLIDYDYPKS